MSTNRFQSLDDLYRKLRERVGDRHIHYGFGNPKEPTVMIVSYFPSHFQDVPDLVPGMSAAEYRQVCQVEQWEKIKNYDLFRSYFAKLFLPSGVTNGTWRVHSSRWLDVVYETCACKTTEPKNEIPSVVEERYLDLLEPEIRLVDPDVIVTAGEVATQSVADALLGADAPSIDKITERKYWDPGLYNTHPTMIPTVHWSAPKNNPNNLEPYNRSLANARDLLHPYFSHDD
ncbi:hypothetical protein ACFPYI_21635 [Halomarina salina]|uniref:Uracil-DNA glycosylase-like domain-containing protein n=1 Tax=Halomarina salina TaxID=1872699 RepID=A0ABD5RU29_9EURY|nr:hypothetical protein [Halomarina salina]